VDYIFHSAQVLTPYQLLSIPTLDELEGLKPNGTRYVLPPLVT
jgi:hypothetical protein